jgi:hypothetical protein
MKVLHCVALLLVLASLAPYTLAHGDHFDEEIFDQSAINAFLQPIFRELQADHAIVSTIYISYCNLQISGLQQSNLGFAFLL